MKRLFLALFAACALAFAGCDTAPKKPDGTPPTAIEQTINVTANSYTLLDSAILGTTDAMKSGLLKGQDARNAVDGLAKAKAGLDVALGALRAANAANAAASGVKK